MNTLKHLTVVLIVLLSAACATVETPNPKDPFEGFNRAAFTFNDAIDAAAFKPLAKGYAAVVPEPARECVGNVFSNFRVPYSAINNLLQGKVAAACEDVARFVINTTFGLGGCFDVASKVSLPNHREDFGQTLGFWGVPAGAYLVLPLIGPTNVRDLASSFSPTDRDLVRQDIKHVPTRNDLIGLRIIDSRASLLKTTDTLDKLDVDRYAFVRDASISRRQNAVYDGDPPDDDNAKTGDIDKDGKTDGASKKDVKGLGESIFSTFKRIFR